MKNSVNLEGKKKHNKNYKYSYNSHGFNDNISE